MNLLILETRFVGRKRRDVLNFETVSVHQVLQVLKEEP